MKNLAMICLALVATAPSAMSADKIRVLILTGSSDFSHPWQPTVPYMRTMLANAGRFDVRVEEEVRGITAATLANYDLLIQYYYGPRDYALLELFKAIARGMMPMIGRYDKRVSLVHARDLLLRGREFRPLRHVLGVAVGVPGPHHHLVRTRSDVYPLADPAGGSVLPEDQHRIHVNAPARNRVRGTGVGNNVRR